MLTISNVQKDRAGQYVCRLRYSVLGVNGTRKAAADVFVYSPGTEKIRTQMCSILKKNTKLFTQSGSNSLLYFLVDDLRCKKTVDEHGIHWEVGVTGMVYYALCPENYVGQ